VANIKNPEIQSFIADLKETMLKEDGIGLAANQLNKDWRMLAVNYKNKPKIFINPRIYYKSWAKEIGEEGCLSFPGIFGMVKRPICIRLLYRDSKGRLRHLRAKGLLARVLQHEVDHIKGILFIDKIIKYTKGRKKLEELKKQGLSRIKADQPDEI